MSFQKLVMAIFFLQPIAFGSWLPRIPEIQARLELGPADLALALLGMPVGILSTLPFAGRVVSRIGGKTAVIAGFFVFSVIVCLPAFSLAPVELFIALALLGVAMSMLELGLNVEADRAEKDTGSIIMNRCHGFWSLGIMAGSLLGSAMVAVAAPAGWAILAAAFVVLPFAVAASLRLPPDREAGSAPPHAPFKPPSVTLLGICAFVFGITMTEGAIADWSAVYLKDVFQTDGMMTGIGYTIFALMVAAGRFSGDHLKQRFGAISLARGCGAAALAGMLIVVFAWHSLVTLAGFALVGIGVSVGFPLAVTAAASLRDRPAAANVAILSFMALTGFLIGPPLIGFIAEASGLRVGLAVLLVPLAISLAFTRMLKARF
ncbi:MULTISPECIES: MFS transporter [unclassified Rhizobium]|uniref:MFS transporter n=1 Tax=unclassified Rhizobium TaxID=2613769 RepID=UPI001042DDBF|nr:MULTISPECIES: MFS transporter [unclassified Rhizobium]TCM69713.1 fucose permease [Rhizobium sp. BK068]